MCFGSASPVQQKVLVPLDLCWAVAPRWMRDLLRKVHKLSVIHIGTEPSIDGFKVCAMSSLVICMRFASRFERSQTNLMAVAPLRSPTRQVRISFVSTSIATHVQMSPASSGAFWAERHVPLLRVAERPNLIELKPFARTAGLLSGSFRSSSSASPVPMSAMCFASWLVSRGGYANIAIVNILIRICQSWRLDFKLR
jgi:hypothetical protein